MEMEEAAGRTVSAQDQSDSRVTEKVESVKDKKRKSKRESGDDKASKKRKTEKIVGSSTEGDAGIISGASETSERNEGAEPNRKKKSKKAKLSDSVEVCDNEIKEPAVGDTGIVTDKVQSVKDEKKKKKKTETSDRASKKGKKDKSVESTMEEGVAAGASEITEMIAGTEPDKKKSKKVKMSDSVEVLSNEVKDAAVRDTGIPTDKVESVKDGKHKKKRASKDDRASKKGKKDKSTTGASETTEGNEGTESNMKKKSKKVQFSDSVEVFSLPANTNEEKKSLEDGSKEKNLDDGLVRGKRFSKKEDEIVLNAVYKYVEDHQLGEDGVSMVMNCRLHKEIKDCWKEIGEAMPWRPYQAVYYRAHILFERSESRVWTAEELDLVKQFVEKHGPDWRTLGDELGKHRVHVKDAWRRIKLPDMKKGSWSQEEYQNLFNLVNKDLSIKAFMDKKSKHGMLRDNISWEAISDKMGTRTDPVCCQKWYNQLSSPLVAEGKWADVDDYRLLMELVDLDATCEEDVDWGNLLEHRPGDVTRKRWNQMVRHIGVHGTKSFSEQVDILSQRYCPDLLEAREVYDSKPVVD